MPISKKCQAILHTNFGRENRIIRNYLKILQNLQQGTKIEKFNEELTKKNLNDTGLKKNTLSYQKSKKPLKEITLKLVNYLKTNWQDEDAWVELALIYEQNQK